MTEAATPAPKRFGAGTWLGLPILPIVFLAIFYQLDRKPAEVEPFIVTHADMLLSMADGPPGEEAPWRRVRVTTNQVTEEPATFVSAWYRIPLTDVDNAGGELRALYVPSPTANLAAFRNRIALGDGGRMQEPLPYHVEPFLFTFEPTPTDGADNLYLRVARKAPRSSIPAFYIGPASVLEPAYERELFLKVRLPWRIVVFMSSLCAIVGAVWLLRRREKAYGWYALFLFLWCAYTVHCLVASVYLDHWLWFALRNLLLWFTLVGAIFVNRFCELSAPRAERAILIFGVVGSVLVVLGGIIEHKPFRDLAWWLIWLPGNNVVAIYGLSQYLRGTFRRHTWENVGMLYCFTLGVAVGIRDVLSVLFDWVPGTSLYLHYTAPITLGMFALSLMHRFVLSLSESERLTASLEARVAQKSRELEANFDRVRELETERALLEERTRIMRDMHDGIGGQLVQVLALTEQDEGLRPIDRSLRRALGDLRLIVDSLVPNEGDLVAVLAAFRHRIAETVAAAGIRFDWQVRDVPKLDELGPEKALHVLRILQEGVTNVLTHAAASRISLLTSTVQDDDGKSRAVRIVLADDGCGFDVDAATHGHGLDNMRRRAGQIGAELAISSSAAGTLLRLELPLHGPRN